MAIWLVLATPVLSLKYEWPYKYSEEWRSNFLFIPPLVPFIPPFFTSSFLYSSFLLPLSFLLFLPVTIGATRFFVVGRG
jgi:hypothetical protein